MKKLDAQQKLTGINGLTIGDFWAWAFSDILTNTTRSVFAEFLVGAALGVLDVPRKEWDAVDLRYNGKKIEVKSSAYLQVWQQKAPSIIRFDIAEKRGWDADTSISSITPLRSADCYVFCLFAEKDATKAEVLNVNLWHFYVMPTERLAQELAQQKSIGLAHLQKLCNAVSYTDLKQQIDEVLNI